jgi:hypothetical protein
LQAWSGVFQEFNGSNLGAAETVAPRGFRLANIPAAAVGWARQTYDLIEMHFDERVAEAERAAPVIGAPTGIGLDKEAAAVQFRAGPGELRHEIIHLKLFLAAENDGQGPLQPFPT